MKTVKILALSAMSLISMQSFAQKAVTELKNPTIKAFVTAIDGTEETATKTVAKYSSQEVIANGMIPMGAKVEIIQEEDNCVTFKTTWVIDADDKENGTDIMVYDICEEGGKITVFELNFDFEEDEE